MTDIVVDKTTNRVWGRVSEENCESRLFFIHCCHFTV